ncbi:MAG: hypothetical protein ACT4QE_21790, partial [Anaerolineales bacterium]
TLIETLRWVDGTFVNSHLLREFQGRYGIVEGGKQTDTNEIMAIFHVQVNGFFRANTPISEVYFCSGTIL